LKSKEGVEIERETQTLATSQFKIISAFTKTGRHDRHGGNRSVRIFRHLTSSGVLVIADERALHPQRRQ